MSLSLTQNASIVKKLKNKIFKIALVFHLFFLTFLSAQSNYYDLDNDNLQDTVILQNNLVTVHFGNRTSGSFELPEITALTNINIGYSNPCEITVNYGGDKALYATINFFYKKGWYIKTVNFNNPCQECKNQNFKILTKNINLPVKNTNSEMLDIDSKGFKSLTFYDSQGIIKSYNNLKKLYTDLSKYPILSYSFNETELLDFKKKFALSQYNIDNYNNIAFILSKNGNQKVAIILLKQIVDKFPQRTVAYLNLADSYWAINNHDSAKENYKKYIVLMNSQKKDLTKIPKYVLERVK